MPHETRLIATIAVGLGLAFVLGLAQAIRIVRRTEAGNELVEARWGLVPSCAKDLQIGIVCATGRTPA